MTLVALNQIDLLPEADRAATQEHLTRLLAEDGLVGVRVLPTSTTTGAGVDALRRELAARVAERRALVTRLDADLDWVASQVAVAVGDTVPAQVPADSAARLARSLAVAAGVDVVADAAGAAHRHRSSQVAGWPPVRWAGRLRPDPLRRLGLDKARSTTRRNQRDAARTGDSGTGLDTVTVGRTSRATPGAVAEAGMDEALRALVDRTATGLPDRWRRRLGEMAGARRAELPGRARSGDRLGGPSHAAPGLVVGGIGGAVAVHRFDGDRCGVAGDHRRRVVAGPARPAHPQGGGRTGAHAAGGGRSRRRFDTCVGGGLGCARAAKGAALRPENCWWTPPAPSPITW